MIDMLKLRIKVKHIAVFDGSICRMDRRGNQLWITPTTKTILESYSSKIYLRSHNLVCKKTGEIARTITDFSEYSNEIFVSEILEIHGNPAKFFQGHNLFGSSDLRAIVPCFIREILEYSNIVLDEDENLEEVISRLVAGDFEIHGVHLNRNYRLDNIEQVNSWLRSTYTVISKNQQTVSIPVTSKSGNYSIYIGKGSDHITSKLYNKGGECRDRGSDFYKNLSKNDANKLLEYSIGILRFEIELKREYLNRLKLSSGKNWRQDTSELLLNFELSKIRIPKNLQLHYKQYNKLPKHLKIPYFLWCNGYNFVEDYPKSKFYQHKEALLAFGIDISRPVAKTEVQSLSKLLIEEIPLWAKERGLYFEPNDYFKNNKIA